MTEDKDMHVDLRIHLDADNVTRINDKVILVDIGTVEEVLTMIMHALDKPGVGVMIKKEGEE